MKKLILIPILIMLISCSVDEQIIKSQQRILDGDSTKNFKLSLIEKSFNYVGWEDGIGIKVPPYDYGYKVTYSPKVFGGTELDTVLTYFCPIGNIAELDYSGANDWVVNKLESGIPTGNGGYNFDGLLAIYTVKDRLPVAEVIKQNFNLSATTYQNGYDPQQQINYNDGLPDAPFMFLGAQTADNYTNRAVARSGKQLIIIVLNPSGLINPEKIATNVVVLPINVTINSTNNSFLGTAVIDESAIAENTTIPPDEVVVTKSQQGKRWIKLDWHCPYHGNGVDTYYIPHHFKVVRVVGGVSKTVYDGEDISEFLDDKIKGNPQSATYEITTTVIGLGESVPTLITVNR